MQIAIDRVKERRPGLVALVRVWLAQYEASRPFWQALRDLRD